MTMELGAILFKVAFWIYLAAAVCYAGHFINKQRLPGSLGLALLAVGLAVHTGSLVVRIFVTERPPFLNLYEYMLSFTWAGVLIYLGLESLSKTKIYGAFAVPLIAVAGSLGMSLDPTPRPVLPALESIWRVPHIASGIFAYAAFGIAFGLGIMYIIKECTEGNEESFWASRLPALGVLDQTIYRTIAFGFLMQTALVIMGAVWAQSAWGRYWGWDQKETWSFITWLVYAAYLHTKATMGWKGRKSVIIAIIGFVAAMFTLYGVNLLGGLHAYT